jgi:large subunit ribosomal protein L10
MKREEKEALVDELGKEIEAAEAIFAIDYRGISVTQSAELRGKLREADTTFRVVKNRLTKLAAAKAGVAELDPMLEGPTALAFVRGDTAMAAKAITTFNREYEVLTYKGGLMDGAELDETKFKAIAKLPSRDALNAQLAGVVASPLVTLTRGLGSLISGLAIQLQQVADQGLVGGTAEPEAAEETPAEEPEAAEEAPAEESAAEAAEEAPAEEPEAVEEAPADEAVEDASDGDGAEAEESGDETGDEAGEADDSAGEANDEAGEADDSGDEAGDEAEESGDGEGDEAGDGGDEEE